MAAFTLDGSNYTVGLNEADTAVLADRLRQGRTLTKGSVEHEVARRDDQLVGSAVRGVWHLMPLLEAVGHEERTHKVLAGFLAVFGVGVVVACMAAIVPLAARMWAEGVTAALLLEASLPLMFACIGAGIAFVSRLTWVEPVLRRSLRARELLHKATATVGVGHKAVYVGTVSLRDGDLKLLGVRLIRYDAIGDANEREGCLCIDDRAGRPLVSMGVAGDGQDLRGMVDFIRRQIPA